MLKENHQAKLETGAQGAEGRRVTTAEPAGEGRPGDLTQLLEAWREGDGRAGEELLQRVYDDLRRLAARELSFERAGCSLQATELVHEVYLRLAGSRRQPPWQDRGHFFAIVSRLARQVLVDLARSRRSRKRTPGEPPGPVLASGAWHDASIDLVAVDQALDRLAEVDRVAVQVVELRHVCGFTVEETARALALGRATVDRKWRAARAWLTGSLAGPVTGEAAR